MHRKSVSSQATGRRCPSDQSRQTHDRSPSNSKTWDSHFRRCRMEALMDSMHDTTDRTLPYSWAICYACAPQLCCMHAACCALLVQRTDLLPTSDLTRCISPCDAIATRALATMPSFY